VFGIIRLLSAHGVWLVVDGRNKSGHDG